MRKATDRHGYEYNAVYIFLAESKKTLLDTRGRSRNSRKGGRSLLSPSSLLLLSLSPLPPLSFPLKVGPLEPARRSGERHKLPSEPRPKNESVHYSKADKKPLVEIILNILSVVFYSRTINI